MSDLLIKLFSKVLLDAGLEGAAAPLQKKKPKPAFEMDVGYESGSDEILKNIKKV